MAQSYARYREKVDTGDVLLFQKQGTVAGFIQRATRSRYSHAGIALWVNERLMVAESKEGVGTHMVPVSSVMGKKTRVDVYKPMPWLAVDRALVQAAAMDRLGQAYGYMAILGHALAWTTVVLPKRLLGKIPFVGGFLEKMNTYSEDDLEDPGKALVCSAFVAVCYRKGGVDLVNNMADAYTTPGDLARSIGLGRALNLER